MTRALYESIASFTPAHYSDATYEAQRIESAFHSKWVDGTSLQNRIATRIHLIGLLSAYNLANINRIYYQSYSAANTGGNADALGSAAIQKDNANAAVGSYNAALKDVRAEGYKLDRSDRIWARNGEKAAANAAAAAQGKFNEEQRKFHIAEWNAKAYARAAADWNNKFTAALLELMQMDSI